jgi:sigma-B regulation protein RsbU (phosphoserine phosphatase)
LDQVLLFIDSQLEKYECGEECQTLVEVSVEEIFNNIVSYAYKNAVGEVEIRCEITGEPPVAQIQFQDTGIPFNPLEADTPDLTEEGLEESEGGLGIHMVRTYMDGVEYQHKDGKNVLTIRKTLVGDEEDE